MNRRSFLHASTLLGFGASVPTFLGKTALAATPAGQPGAAETVLVVLQLTGGNDGLNTVVPMSDPDYYRLRPTIAIKKGEALKLNADTGLHPAMKALAKLYEDEALTVVQGVGYPNPDQSHFRSMDIWQAGSTEANLPEGWLGKALKQKPLPGFHLASGAGDAAPLALTGAPTRVPSLGSLADFQLKTAGATASDMKAQSKLIAANAMPAPTSAAPKANLLDFVQRTATNTYASSERLRDLAKNYQTKVTYPATALGQRLKLAAQLLDAGTGARLFYVNVDGFDTHSGQGGATGAHAGLWEEISEAVGAFYADLKHHGHAERVCLMTFSEFGRRAHENGSQGTDHGAAAPMLLVGGKLTGGVVGEAPKLTKLDNGNLAHHIDFRQVYAGLLTAWLKLDAKAVLGAGHKPLGLFKA